MNAETKRTPLGEQGACWLKTYRKVSRFGDETEGVVWEMWGGGGTIAV